MSQKTLIKAEFGTPRRTDKSDEADWTRSFPSGSVEGTGWMLDVLEDLRAYARHHHMGEAEDLLADTLHKLDRLVQRHH